MLLLPLLPPMALAAASAIPILLLFTPKQLLRSAIPQLLLPDLVLQLPASMNEMQAGPAGLCPFNACGHPRQHNVRTISALVTNLPCIRLEPCADHDICLCVLPVRLIVLFAGQDNAFYACSSVRRKSKKGYQLQQCFAWLQRKEIEHGPCRR